VKKGDGKVYFEFIHLGYRLHEEIIMPIVQKISVAHQ